MYVKNLIMIITNYRYIIMSHGFGGKLSITTEAKSLHIWLRDSGILKTSSVSNMHKFLSTLVSTIKRFFKFLYTEWNEY